MKLLVTGGAGFIGGNFINYTLKTHPLDEIVCLDKLTYAGNLSTLARAFAAKNFRFVKGDIADAAAVGALFLRERFDAVVNFAAESHVDRSIGGAGAFIASNVDGVRVLLDACNRHGVGRFHQVSTDEVYGDLPVSCGGPGFGEGSPLRPSNPYSASKAAADLLVMAYRRTYGTPVTISRSSNNYGPFQHPEKFIPLAITRALAGERIPLYGDGRNVRDWLYVEDNCRAVDLIVREGREGCIYNIGGGYGISNIALARRIVGMLGRGESLIEPVPDRPGHDRRYALDCSFISSGLGWKPLVPFGEGLERTVRWYKENGEWLKGFKN